MREGIQEKHFSEDQPILSFGRPVLIYNGPFRFGSFPRPVPAGSRIERFCLVRFGRFGSVSYSFLNIATETGRATAVTVTVAVVAVTVLE